jgi:hypothetical protein
MLCNVRLVSSARNLQMTLHFYRWEWIAEWQASCKHASECGDGLLYRVTGPWRSQRVPPLPCATPHLTDATAATTTTTAAAAGGGLFVC